MDIRLDGRTAVVTGGSRGLGLATATRMAESGADVAIFARRRTVLDESCATIAKTAAGRVVGIECDVSKADSIEAGFAQVMKELGKVDILVNNAGQSMRGPFDTLSDADWQSDLDLKLFAAIRTCRQVWPQMKERRWGRIINVLNIGAKSPEAGGAPTAVSRAAGLSFTKILAGEGAPHNILVNALLVGAIVSDQIINRYEAAGRKFTVEELIAKRGAEVPMGRMGEAAEFGNVACFLASDAASYVTGVSIPVDGGKAPFI